MSVLKSGLDCKLNTIKNAIYLKLQKYNRYLKISYIVRENFKSIVKSSTSGEI